MAKKMGKNMKPYHGNLLNTEFENEDFLEKYRILEKRASTRDNWIHYLIEIPEQKLEEAIQDIQTNLQPKPWYAHLYNEDGSNVIVIFKTKIFRLPADDENGWEAVDKFMEEYGLTTTHWKAARPRKFSEENEYYKNKPLIR